MTKKWFAKKEDIKAVLVESLLTREDLARKVGRTKQYMSAIINGNISPGITLTRDISAALKVEPTEIFELI